jgi:hypothetical protein
MYRMCGTPALQEQNRYLTTSTQSYQVLVRFLPLKAGLAGRAGFSG